MELERLYIQKLEADPEVRASHQLHLDALNNDFDNASIDKIRENPNGSITIFNHDGTTTTFNNSRRIERNRTDWRRIIQLLLEAVRITYELADVPSETAEILMDLLEEFEAVTRENNTRQIESKLRAFIRMVNSRTGVDSRLSIDESSAKLLH